MLARKQLSRLSNVLNTARLSNSRSFQWTHTRMDNAPTSHISRRARPTFGALPNRSALVHLSSLLYSPIQFYTVIRELERRYGAIRDYSGKLDGEVPTMYQALISVSFRDPEAFERISSTGDLFQLELPPHPSREGGPSLDDLKPLLFREEYIERRMSDSYGTESVSSTLKNDARNRPESKDHPRVIEVKIRRARGEHLVRPPRSSEIPKSVLAKQARAFLDWGGFDTLPLIPANESRLDENSLFRRDAPPDFARRMAFQNYAKFLDIKNSHQVASENSVGSPNTPTSKEERSLDNLAVTEDFVDPIPGSEHLTEDEAPMPSHLESDTEATDLSNAPLYAVPTSQSPILAQNSSSELVPDSAHESYEKTESPKNALSKLASVTTDESVNTTRRPPSSNPAINRLNNFMGW